jgi:Glycosyl hydrolase family 26
MSRESPQVRIESWRCSPRWSASRASLHVDGGGLNPLVDARTIRHYDKAESRLSLSIMQPFRATTGIRVLATLVTVGSVIVTAACSNGGSGTQAATASPSGWHSSSGTSSSATSTGLGLYDGYSKPSGIETAAQWLGSSSSIKYAMDFIDATDWAHIEDPYQLSSWKNSPFTMIWGVPMIPCGSPSTQCQTNVSDYDLVASGGANDHFKTLAENLVSAGFGNSYIRLGWEMNSSVMSWAICNQQGSAADSWIKDFVPAFQNIVTSMRSVSGANFKFIWNPIDTSSSSCPGVHMEDLYPGDKYVDAVGLDVYDGIATPMSDTTRFSDLRNGTGSGGYVAESPYPVNGQSFNGQGYGLNWLAAFGKAHNKEISLPEWGLESTSNDAGGGDDAYFMTQMADWIKANATGPVIFWNEGNSSGTGTLPLDIPNYTTAATPTATAAFKAAFASGA